MNASGTTSSTTATTAVASTKGPVIMGLVGAAGFALTYLVSDPISSTFASSPAPQPNVSGDVTRAWFVDNAAAGAVQAAIMVVSVAFLAVFVGAVAMITRRVGGAARRAAIGAGVAAVGAMVVSSALSWVLAASAATLSPDTVGVLRTAGFIAGGTAHVAFLGLFALAVSRIPGMSKPVRVSAIVLAVIAVGSLVSLGVYYAAILILAGRLLGMVWCVVAAISLARRARTFRTA